MRILQVSNRVPWPLNEGGTIGIYNFTKSFAEQGHEVSLYCLDAYKHHTPIKEAMKELSRYAKTYIHPIDTDVRIDAALKNLFTSKSYNVERFQNEVFRKELADLLTKEKFDVVQLEGTYAGPYISTIRSLHNGPLILRMHNAEFEIWERLASNSKNPIKAQYLSLLAKRLKSYEKELLKQVDLIATVTADDAAKFKQLLPSARTIVIPAGIDTSYWNYTPLEGFNHWYHLGSLAWTPNLEAVKWFETAVLPKLWEENEQMVFHLAGKGMDKLQFDANAHFVLHGQVEDAFKFTRDKQVCVVPLLSGSGIRLKILEAMAAGKLVVSTSVGIQGIEAQAGVHLLVADTPEEFAAIMKQLKSGTLNPMELVKNARILVEDHYSIEAVAKQLITHFEAELAQKVKNNGAPL